MSNDLQREAQVSTNKYQNDASNYEQQNDASKSQVGREKTWEEMSDAQRIAKLRQVVRGNVRTITRLVNKLEKLQGHSHDKFGVPVSRIQDDDNERGNYDPLA